MRSGTALTLILLLVAGCGPRPQPRDPALLDPRRPLPLLPAWEAFVMDSYPRVVASLIDPAQSIDFGKGPDSIRADFVADSGSFLTAAGAVEYVDNRGVRMQAGYFARWEYPGLTNAADTPWLLSSAGLLDKRPVPPPADTQPADTQPATPVVK